MYTEIPKETCDSATAFSKAVLTVVIDSFSDTCLHKIWCCTVLSHSDFLLAKLVRTAVATNGHSSSSSHIFQLCEFWFQYLLILFNSKQLSLEFSNFKSWFELAHCSAWQV